MMSDEPKKLTSAANLSISIDKIKELRRQDKAVEAQAIARTKEEEAAKKETEQRAYREAQRRQNEEAYFRQHMQMGFDPMRRATPFPERPMAIRSQLPVKPVQEFPGVPSRGEIEYYGLIEVQQKMTIRITDGKPQTVTAIVWVGPEDYRHPQRGRR